MLDDKKCNPAHLFLDGIFGVSGKIVYFCRLMMRCVAMVADKKFVVGSCAQVGLYARF